MDGGLVFFVYWLDLHLWRRWIGKIERGHVEDVLPIHARGGGLRTAPEEDGLRGDAQAIVHRWVQ